MSKDKDDEPKAKGGRRSKRPVTDVRMKNLKPWPKGTSGNPAGQPKSVVEINKLAREMTPAVLHKLNEIVHDPESSNRDKINAAIAIADRGCGRPAVGIFHGTGPNQPPGFVLEGGTEDDNALLLRAANEGNADERTLAALDAAASRVKAKIAQDKQAKEDHLADAAAAMARGEEVPGLTRLLLNAKAASAANADRRAAAAPPAETP